MLDNIFQHVSTKETKCIRHSAIIIDGYIHKSTEENKLVMFGSICQPTKPHHAITQQLKVWMSFFT